MSTSLAKRLQHAQKSTRNKPQNDMSP